MLNYRSKKLRDARRTAEQRHDLLTSTRHDRAMLQKRYAEMLGNPLDAEKNRELRAVGSMLGRSLDRSKWTFKRKPSRRRRLGHANWTGNYMAFEAGTISGKLDLDTTSFEGGMREAHTHAETEGGRIRETLEAVSEVFSETLGPAAAQFGQQLQSIFAGFSEGPMVGSLNIVGQALGALRESTESVGEKFEQMGLVAKRAGVNVEWMSKLAAVGQNVGVGVDQLGMAFKILEERAGEAADGTKDAVEGFKRVGLSVSDALALSSQPEELFKRVQLAIGKMADQGQRAATSSELLGRAGSQLIPLFSMTADQFKAASDRAGEFGATVSETDVVAGESLTRMQNDFSWAFTGIEREVSKPIFAFVESHMVGLERTFKSASHSIRGAIDNAWTFIGDQTKDLLPTLENAATVVGHGLVGGFEDLVAMARSAGPAIADVGKLWNSNFKPVVGELIPLVESLWSAGKSLATVYGQVLYAAFKADEPVIAHLSHGLQQLLQDTTRVLEAIAKLGTANDTISNGIRDFFPDSARDLDKHFTKIGFDSAVVDVGYNPYDPKAKIPKKVGNLSTGIQFDLTEDQRVAGRADDGLTVVRKRDTGAMSKLEFDGRALPVIDRPAIPNLDEWSRMAVPNARAPASSSTAPAKPVVPPINALPRPSAGDREDSATGDIIGLPPITVTVPPAASVPMPRVQPAVHEPSVFGGLSTPPTIAMPTPYVQLPSPRKSIFDASTTRAAAGPASTYTPQTVPQSAFPPLPKTDQAIADSIAAHFKPSSVVPRLPHRSEDVGQRETIPASNFDSINANGNALGQAFRASTDSLGQFNSLIGGLMTSAAKRFADSVQQSSGVFDLLRDSIESAVSSFRSFSVPTPTTVTAGQSGSLAAGGSAAVTNNYNVRVDAKADDSANQLGRTIAAGLQRVRQQSRDAQAAAVTRAMAQQSMGGN